MAGNLAGAAASYRYPFPPEANEEEEDRSYRNDAHGGVAVDNNDAGGAMTRVLGLIVLLLAGCDAAGAGEQCLTDTLRGYQGYVPTQKLQVGIGGHAEARALVEATFEMSSPPPLFEACAAEVDRKLFKTHTADAMASAWLACVQENC